VRWFPTHPWRPGVAQGGRASEPIGHADRDLSPADAPRRAGAIPPDPAPAVLETHQRVIGGGRGTKNPIADMPTAKANRFIADLLLRSHCQAAAARLPKRFRFSFFFSLRAGNLTNRPPVPP